MSASCPECGKPVGPNALQGLCPECLMKVGLGSEVQPDPAAAGGPPPGKSKAFVPPTPEELAPLFPQLEILGLLGQGGMGAVYKARQRHLEREVALKILPLEAGRELSLTERFAREAKVLARLNHPNIVSVYDSGQQGGFYYFLMEFVDGVNLRQLERSHRPAAQEALSIVEAICEALQYAHQQGLVHRDIKPENILINKQGQVKIADFGIAKVLDAERRAPTLTGAQQVIGTPHYMAPEQVETPGAVDHRADIYSLGVVFYELLTGELPLGKFAPPSQKAPLDTRLDEVVLRTLEKEPDKRYQQAREVKTEIETISTAPAPEPLPDRVDELEGLTSEVRRYRRLTMALWASALVLVPLLCVLALITWSKWQAIYSPPSQPPVAQRQPATVTDADIRKTSAEEWFSRLGRDEELGYGAFTVLNTLPIKAKESDQVRDQIIRLATETIDDPRRDMFKRWQCCYVLSSIGDARGIAPVSRALKDPSDLVRGVAACALGQFENAEARAALEQAAGQERDPKVLESIQKALRGEYKKMKD